MTESELVLKGAGRTMRRAWTETFVSVGCLGALIATLAFFDERVRQQLFDLGSNPRSTGLAYGTGRLHAFVSMLYYIARDQSQQHTVLMTFAIAAIVLFIFMLRS
ncbi:MAG TPA: hypothetical protein VGJ29_07375 [Vicinamibacterales bacterium]|jgi:hypothetical protein